MNKPVMGSVLQPPRRAGLLDSVREEAVPVQTSPEKNVCPWRNSNETMSGSMVEKGLGSLTSRTQASE